MSKLATLGLAMVLAGSARMAEHAPAPLTLEDYLAFRCGDSTSLSVGSSLEHAVSHAHCWGCYSIVAGAALMVLAVWQTLRAQRPSSLYRL